MDESQLNAINLEKEIADGLKAVLDKEKKNTVPEAEKAPVTADTRMMDINVIRNQVKKNEAEQESFLEEDMVDKQVTGQLSVEDILAEWERREKEKNTPVRSQWEEPENTMPEAPISQEESEESDAAEAAGTEVENPVSEQEQSSGASWQEAADAFPEESEPYEEAADTFPEESEPYEEAADTFPEESEP